MGVQNTYMGGGKGVLTSVFILIYSCAFQYQNNSFDNLLKFVSSANIHLDLTKTLLDLIISNINNVDICESMRKNYVLKSLQFSLNA